MFGTVKKVAIWVAIIWAANSAGAHGYRVGTIIGWVARTTGSVLVGTANAVGSVDKK